MSNIAQKTPNIPRTLIASWIGATTPANSTGEQLLYTFSIPANTFGTKKGVKFKAVLRRTTGTGSVTVNLKLASTNINTGVLLSTQHWNYDGTIWGNNATNSQEGFVIQTSVTGGTTTTAATYSTFALDSTAAIAFNVYITQATGTDVMTLKYLELLAVES